MLSESDYESMFKKILPHLNAIIEIDSSYEGNDAHAVFSFDSDGSFVYSPAYSGPMLIRMPDDDYPHFNDSERNTHTLVKENGKVLWKTD